MRSKDRLADPLTQPFNPFIVQITVTATPTRLTARSAARTSPVRMCVCVYRCFGGSMGLGTFIHAGASYVYINAHTLTPQTTQIQSVNTHKHRRHLRLRGARGLRGRAQGVQGDVHRPARQGTYIDVYLYVYARVCLDQ